MDTHTFPENSTFFDFGLTQVPVKKFPYYQVDPEDLLQALHEALLICPFNDFNQILLTSLDETTQDPYKGIGSLYSRQENKWIYQESDFKYFIDQFKKLRFYQMFQDIKKLSPFEIGRVRLMKLPPKKCYSLHRDQGMRFHFAIQTNPNSFLTFRTGIFQVPADGFLYLADTTQEHSAFNGGDTDRIHLVFSTIPPNETVTKLK